ncbi:unnamed protein product [Prorocentrum cordatum]|uniref:Uncharacterized protein n=1 Tax=Prorocentrum cordatum TaxID=2364126 RepID=A0ABN9QNV5_9DINO|nr:unnamed protein product [Polarella glacialis]
MEFCHAGSSCCCFGDGASRPFENRTNVQFWRFGSAPEAPLPGGSRADAGNSRGHQKCDVSAIVGSPAPERGVRSPSPLAKGMILPPPDPSKARAEPGPPVAAVG